MNQSELRINSKCASFGRLSNGIVLTHSVENEYLHLKLLSFQPFCCQGAYGLIWIRNATELIK